MLKSKGNAAESESHHAKMANSLRHSNQLEEGLMEIDTITKSEKDNLPVIKNRISIVSSFPGTILTAFLTIQYQ